MSAEKPRGIFLTGIVSAGFAILGMFVVVVFTGMGEKITNSVGKDYVDEKDKVLEQSFNDYKTEHNKSHEKEYEDTARNDNGHSDVSLEAGQRRANACEYKPFEFFIFEEPAQG